MLTDGIYENLTRAQYDAEEAVNMSSLVNMAVSPSYYQWVKRHPKDSEALRFGRAADLALFEPLLFERNYIKWTGYDDKGEKTIKRGSYWEDFKALAANQELEIIDEDDYELCLEIRKAVKRDKFASEYLYQGHQQVAIIWHDPETHLRCKGLLDWLTLRAALCDLKTGRSVIPRKFTRDGSELHYPAKMAWYHDGLEILGRKPSETVLIAVEKTGPLDVVVFEMDDDTLAFGRYEYRGWMTELNECLQSDNWPGISRGKKQRFEVPRYLRGEYDRLEMNAVAEMAQGLETLPL